MQLNVNNFNPSKTLFTCAQQLTQRKAVLHWTFLRDFCPEFDYVFRLLWKPKRVFDRLQRKVFRKVLKISTTSLSRISSSDFDGQRERSLNFGNILNLFFFLSMDSDPGQAPVAII